MNTKIAFALLAILALASDAMAQPTTGTTAAVPPAATMQANMPAPAAAPLAANASVFLIRGGTVHTMSDLGVMQGADVIISNGKIMSVGVGLAPPQGAQVIEAHGRPVTPGLMASFTQLGINEIDLEQQTNDSTADGDIASAAFDVTDALNPNSSIIPVTRIGGVTRVLVAPNPGTSIFSGQAAVIELGLGPNILVKPHVGMFVVFNPFNASGGNTAEQYDSGGGTATAGGGTRLSGYVDRPVLWAAFREEIADAREYLAKQAQYHAPGGSRDQRTVRIDLDALAPVLRGEEPIVAVVDRASDIRQLLAYTKQQNLKLIIKGGAEAWMVAKDLAAANVPVLIDAYTNLPNDFSSLGATLANAARLDAAGVKIAFLPPSDAPTHNARRVGQIAGNAMANGMNYEHALAAITRNPAEIWGIADSYGSLAPGKDADVVVWDGDPLDVLSAPTDVFIKGQKIPLVSRQTRLRDRYRDLNNKDMPFGYR